MTFASEASKLLTNKYFLYFIAFLAISNVVGYLVTNKLKAVAFFVLVCILAYNFSKNMTVVLIIAIVTTNLMMVNKSMREGFREGAENMDAEGTEGTTTTDTTMTDTTETADDSMNSDGTMSANPPVKRAVKEVQTIGKVTEPTKQAIKTDVMEKKPTTTPTTTTSTTTTATEVETFAPAGAGYNGKKRGAIGGPAKAARIDYSTTLEQAYENLDKMLGSGGLNNLSADTEKLMAQQERLFGSVQKFLPLIDKAQGMISSLDMDKINSLVGMTDKFGGLTGGAGLKPEAFAGSAPKK
jgi:hypothetical protein